MIERCTKKNYRRKSREQNKTGEHNNEQFYACALVVETSLSVRYQRSRQLIVPVGEQGDIDVEAWSLGAVLGHTATADLFSMAPSCVILGINVRNS